MFLSVSTYVTQTLHGKKNFILQKNCSEAYSLHQLVGTAKDERHFVLTYICFLRVFNVRKRRSVTTEQSSTSALLDLHRRIRLQNFSLKRKL